MILDAKMDFQNTSFVRSARRFDYLKRYTRYQLDFYCLQSVSPLLEPLLTMSTSHLTKHIVPHFIKT